MTEKVFWYTLTSYYYSNSKRQYILDVFQEQIGVFRLIKGKLLFPFSSLSSQKSYLFILNQLKRIF